MLSPRNIQAHSDHALRPAGLVPVDFHPAFEPSNPAVRQQDSIFDMKLTAGFQAAEKRIAEFFTVLGMHLFQNALKRSGKRARSAAVDPFEPRRPDDGAGLNRPFPVTHSAGVERLSQ